MDLRTDKILFGAPNYNNMTNQRQPQFSKKARLYALAAYRSRFNPIFQSGRTETGGHFLNVILPDGGKVIGFKSEHSKAHCYSQLYLLQQQARKYAQLMGWTVLTTDESGVI